MVRIVHRSPYGDLEVKALGVVVPAGEVIDVPAGVAGKAPKGDDPGEGLLSQADVWFTAAADKKEG